MNLICYLALKVIPLEKGPINSYRSFTHTNNNNTVIMELLSISIIYINFVAGEVI